MKGFFSPLLEEAWMQHAMEYLAHREPFLLPPLYFNHFYIVLINCCCTFNSLILNYRCFTLSSCILFSCCTFFCRLHLRTFWYKRIFSHLNTL